MTTKTEIEAMIRDKEDAILKEDWLRAEDICYKGNASEKACSDASAEVRREIKDNDLFCDWQKGYIELKGNSLRKASKDRFKRIGSQIKNTFLRNQKTTNICTATTGRDYKQTVVCSAKRPSECPIDFS